MMPLWVGWYLLPAIGGLCAGAMLALVMYDMETP